MSKLEAEILTPRFISWLVAETFRWVLFGALIALVILLLSDAALKFTLTIPLAALLFVAIWVSALTGIVRARRAFGPPRRRSEASPSAARLNSGSSARVWAATQIRRSALQRKSVHIGIPNQSRRGGGQI